MLANEFYVNASTRLHLKAACLLRGYREGCVTHPGLSSNAFLLLPIPKHLLSEATISSRLIAVAGAPNQDHNGQGSGNFKDFLLGLPQKLSLWSCYLHIEGTIHHVLERHSDAFCFLDKLGVFKLVFAA